MSQIKISQRSILKLGAIAASVSALTFAFTNCSGSFNAQSLSSSLAATVTGSSVPIARRSFLLAANEIELVLQPSFGGGTRVVPACADPGTGDCDFNHDYRITNPLNPTLSNSEVPWELAQWDMTTNLPTTSTRNADGSYSYADAQKSITFFPDGRVRMFGSGLARYNGAYRTDNTRWIGYIAQQPMSAPGILSHSSGTIAQIQSMNFSIDLHLVSDERNIRAGYNSSIHASQFPIFFTIQNLKIGHPDYGKYVWLGIPVYDDRTPFMEGNTMLDIGTNSLMYSRPYRDFATKSLHSGEWVHLETDILPHAKEAIAAAVQRGIFSSGDLNNFMIGGMNIGMEITGLNNLTMEFQNLSLRIVNPTLMGSSPVPGSSLAPAAQRTVAFGNAGGSFSQTFVASEQAALASTVRVFNTVSGRSVNVRLNLDSTSHAILSANSVGSPYFCYDQNQAPCANVTVPAGYPGGGTSSQNCYSAVRMTGALSGNLNNVQADLSCAAPVPDTPEGFWQIPNEPGVYYSNGRDAYCIFTDYDTYLRWHGGNPTVDGYRQLPRNMRNDGVCP